jgi:uroporphyrinogen III methyltransferase/synthase
MSKDPARVFLIGAGPGHPGYLTLRAIECLAQADFVLYDQLVPVQLLEHARAEAERFCVSELHSCRAERWSYVHEKMIEAARQGKCVARLKGGDPFIFGRGGEEAAALRQAGIPYEIVPGVTAATAAAACAGIPLTHRLYASAVALVAGHENPAKPESQLDWQALAAFPGTLVFYMGLRRLPRIVQALLECGKSPTTPAAVIEQGSTGEQRTVSAGLAELPEAVRSAGLKSPTIIVIGTVAALRSELAWFEKRPLFGKQVLVTRPREQAASLVRRLDELGAVVHVQPMVAIREPDDWSEVDHALGHLERYQWLAFTSANGVHAFVRRLGHIGRDLRALGGMQLAAIGPKTAAALRSYCLEPDLIPEAFCSESLAAALKQQAAGQRVLLARADRGRELLREELAAVAEVDQIAVYSQVDVTELAPAIRERLQAGKISFVTLTSANIAGAFIQSLDARTRQQIEDRQLQLVTISPVTSARVVELGLPVGAEAEEYTSEGVVAAVLRLADKSAQFAQSIPGEVEKHAAGQKAENVHGLAQAAKRNAHEKVEDEQ